MSSLDKFRNQYSGSPIEVREFAERVAQELTPKTHPLVKAATTFLEAQAAFEELLEQLEVEVG